MPLLVRRARRQRRIAVAWLLAVGVTGVLGAAQARAAARDHACCRSAPVRAELPPAPCPSLLPLACCDATVLPAPAHHSFDLGDPALGGAALDPVRPLVPDRRTQAAAAPRASPLALSVVLRL